MYVMNKMNIFYTQIQKLQNYLELIHIYDEFEENDKECVQILITCLNSNICQNNNKPKRHPIYQIQ